MDCENCKNEFRIKSLEEDRERNSNQHKEFYEKFEESRIASATFKEKFDRIMDSLSEIKSDLNELKSKPDKRWEKIISAVIGGVIVIVLGYVFRGI